MAATASVSWFSGAGASENTGVTTLVMKWLDDNVDDATGPIVRGAGTEHSWAKSLKLNFSTSPAGAITNLRFFSAAANFGGSWTGVSMLATSGAYARGAVTDQGATARSGMSNRTSAAMLTINAGEVIANPTTGLGTQDYTILQVSIANTAPAGASDTQTQTFRYAET